MHRANLHLISTRLQPGENAGATQEPFQRLGFGHEKPLKRLASSSPWSTGLKPGANERGHSIVAGMPA